MPVLGDETGGLGEGAVLVLHDEATLFPVAQQDGKLRLGAMNLTDVLNLSLVKGVMNVEKKIAHTGSMTHRAAVCIYRLLHLIAEETRRHCMMLENCCYDAFALTTLNMVQQGVLGEITHAEGAYIHDLRKHYFADEKAGGYHNHWIKLYSQQHTGNPYPTHGLGPVCQWMNIHRGDRMEYLVSMSSRQAGLSAYAGQVFGASSEEAAQSYEMGDVNTTLIHTAKGRTILLQYDVTTPRPYSRHQTVCGTKGFMQKYPVPCLLLDEYGKEPLSGEQFERMMEQYKHPFTAVIGEEARRKNMPNEMNYIMDYRLIHCLRNGLPLDQDVYDAAEWSCITELSERSVRQGSVPVEIPDFTRGNWKER